MIVCMNEPLFPKPPPAKPIPLGTWLDRTDRAEVGREPFFCGRDLEYCVFQKAVNSLNDGQIGGGTMIFQGAPGAGKTALMNECMEAVRLHSTPQDPWAGILIEADTLQSAANVVMILIEEANRERERLAEQFPGQVPGNFEKLAEIGRKFVSELSKRGYGVSAGGLDLTVHGKPDDASNQEAVLAERVFRDAAPQLKDMHMVVFVDEAQNTPDTPPTKDVLDCLHRDTQGIPLIAAFFGLSDTQSVLGQCGLSRLPKDRVVTLDTLSLADARSAIQGVFDAYGFKGSSQITWVEALADLSQGWPQHVNNVSVAAGQVISDHGGSIHEDLLLRAIRLGKELKEEYYTHRLAACSGEPWVYKKLAQEAQDRNGVLSWDEIDELTQFARSKKQQSTDDFLIDALHAGVLVETRKLPKHYEIPIPSLGDYLRELPVTLPSKV